MKRRLLALVVLVLALGWPRGATADDPPAAAAKLPARQANYAWDKTLLRASFSYRDVVDAPLTSKLSSGLPTVIAMRAYVFADGQDAPVALSVRTCRIVYDLWDEVYRIKITGTVVRDATGASESAPERDTAAVSTDGVLRQCAEARDLPIADKSQLKIGTPYYLGVIVDVNPVSPEMLEQMRRWVSRPTGSTNIAPGDALFGSFVGLFVRNIGTSDRTLKFRTQNITP